MGEMTEESKAGRVAGVVAQRVERESMMIRLSVGF